MWLSNGTWATVMLCSFPWPHLRAQQPDTAHIDRVFARFASDSTPGCAIAITRDGTMLFQKAYGMADLERNVPNRSTAIFEAGSVTKQFTAAAIVLLADRGKLWLDDDIRRWFPEVHNYGTPITVRHLLQHTSGLRDWGAIVELEGWPRGTRTIDHRYVFAVIARQRGLNHPVGAAYSYTNTGYSLLTMLVERITGESHSAFTTREFFRPLGMTNTSWRDDYSRVVRNRAQAYQPDGSSWRLDMPFENPHGHGGLLTTVEDLLRWTQALAERRVGTPRVAPIMEVTGVLTDGKPITYAAGLVVDLVRGVREIGHSGSTAGYNTHLARYPDSKVAAAVLCNASGAGATSLLRQSVAEMVGWRPLPPVPQRPPTEPTPVTQVTVEGMRGFIGRWISVEADARWTLSLSNDSLQVSRHAGDRRTFRVTGPDRFASGSIELRFERNASGEVVRMLASISRAVDVPFLREQSP